MSFTARYGVAATRDRSNLPPVQEQRDNAHTDGSDQSRKRASDDDLNNSNHKKGKISPPDLSMEEAFLFSSFSGDIAADILRYMSAGDERPSIGTQDSSSNREPEQSSAISRGLSSTSSVTTMLNNLSTQGNGDSSPRLSAALEALDRSAQERAGRQVKERG